LSTYAKVLEAGAAPQVGTPLNWIAGIDLDDKPVKYNYAQREKRTLLFVFSRDSSYCGENWKYWNLLLRDSRHFDVTIADVAANADSDYFNNLGITPRNVIKVSREIQVAYKLNAVPTTIVLGPTGRVEGTWIGLLTNGRVREIETALLRN
jgi:hypothetical protein